MNEAKAREAEAQTRYQRINDMYQRRVVAKATLDEASAGRATRRWPGWSRRAPGSSRRAKACRTRRIPCAVRRRRHAAARAGGRSGGARHAAHERRIARRAARRGGRAAERHRAGACGAQGGGVRGRPAHRGDGRHAVPVGPAAVEHLPRPHRAAEEPREPRARHVRQGRAWSWARTTACSCRARRSWSAARCAACTSWRPTAAWRCGRCASGTVRGDRVEILAGVVAGEHVALDPAAAGLKARRPATKHD